MCILSFQLSLNLYLGDELVFPFQQYLHDDVKSHRHDARGADEDEFVHHARGVGHEKYDDSSHPLEYPAAAECALVTFSEHGGY